MEHDRSYFHQTIKSIYINQSQNHTACMVEQHYHNSYELYYLLDGQRNYFIKDRIYSIKKGALIFIGMNELHRTTDADVSFYNRILINFKPSFLDSLFPLKGIDLFECFKHSFNAVKLSINEQIYIENLLCRMMHEYDKKDYGYELYLKSMLVELLLLLNRHILHNPEDEFDNPDLQHKKVMFIINHINSNYADTLTLSNLSKLYFYSASYLSRIFKQVTGFKFAEYVNSIRIMESIKLLKETQLSITQISEKVGYESTTHFGRVFKQITGQSPREYRKSASSSAPFN